MVPEVLPKDCKTIKEAEEYLNSYGIYVWHKGDDVNYIKYLLSIGRAYPCFCSQEELDNIRTIQEKNKLIPGYYAHFAKCRFLTNEERAERIKNGEPFVIRFKSSGNHVKKIKVKDA